MRAIVSFRALVAVVFPTIIMLSGSVMGAAISPADTPQAWADQLVALYSQKPHTAEAGRAWDQWYESLYDPEFSKLIADNHVLAGRILESIGSLDHDPLCGCQSGSGYFRINSVGLRQDGVAEVKASHCYKASGCGDVDLILKRIGGAWKLYDAMERSSVRDMLVHDNACMRSGKSQSDMARCFRRRHFRQRAVGEAASSRLEREENNEKIIHLNHLVMPAKAGIHLRA